MANAEITVSSYRMRFLCAIIGDRITLLLVNIVITLTSVMYGQHGFITSGDHQGSIVGYSI